MKRKYKYEVAFSFLEQDESIAIALNDRIQDRVSTFIYSYHQRELAGKDGESTLNKIFGTESRIAVILFRKEWGKTPWTRIEETAIRNRGYQEGYDFCLIVSLDNQQRPPRWVPKNRIWIGLAKYGVDGAAAVIEARIQEAGGSVREETVEDHAERLRRKLATAEKRKAFLESAKAVKPADQEANDLFEALEKSVSSLSSKEIPISIQKVSRGIQWGVKLISYSIEISVYWHRHFTNDLDDSGLVIRVREHVNDVYSGGKYNDLKMLEYKFELSETEQYGWISTDYNKKFYLSEQLCDYTLKLLLDYAANSRLKRLQKIN